jgi:hypothetical protein
MGIPTFAFHNKPGMSNSKVSQGKTLYMELGSVELEYNDVELNT